MRRSAETAEKVYVIKSFLLLASHLDGITEFAEFYFCALQKYIFCVLLFCDFFASGNWPGVTFFGKHTTVCLPNKVIIFLVN